MLCLVSLKPTGIVSNEMQSWVGFLRASVHSRESLGAFFTLFVEALLWDGYAGMGNVDRRIGSVSQTFFTTYSSRMQRIK